MQIRTIKLDPATLEPSEDGVLYQQILDDEENVISTEAVSQPEMPPDPKGVKITELNAACNAEILAGFSSSALGEPNDYDFDYEAQINLTEMLQAINNDMVTEPIFWKASGEPKPHTIAQFKALFADGLEFKNSRIQRYWSLKAQVLAATTQEEIDAIVW